MHSRALSQVFTRKIEGRARDWRRPSSLCRPGRGETTTEKRHGTPLMSLLPVYYELLWELFSVKEKSSYNTIYRYSSSTHFFSQALCRAYTNEWDLILAFMELHLLRKMGPGCTHHVISWPRKVLRGSGDKKITFTWGSGALLSPGWCKCCDRHTKGGGVGRQFTQLNKIETVHYVGTACRGWQWHVAWALKNWPDVEKNQWNKAGRQGTLFFRKSGGSPGWQRNLA